MKRHRRTDPICRRYRPLSPRTALGRWLAVRARGRRCPICSPTTLHLAAPPPSIRFEWRSAHPAPTEAKRAAILDGKPECRACGRMFHTRMKPPSDLLCRDCRRESPAPEADTLF